VSGPLTGKVALVAGATRGGGRGTAVALGEAGATVYCTGRTTRSRRSEYDRPETIEETAELVDAAGGEGIAAEVDHLEPVVTVVLAFLVFGESLGPVPLAGGALVLVAVLTVRAPVRLAVRPSFNRTTEKGRRR